MILAGNKATYADLGAGGGLCNLKTCTKNTVQYVT
jgi:hypothetical protein